MADAPVGVQEVLRSRMGPRPGVRRRSLSHVALMFRPGEGHLAATLLGLFGLEVIDMGPHRDSPEHWYSGFIDDTSTVADNLVFLLPATGPQLALEQVLVAALAASPATAEAVTSFDAFAQGDPERSFHFGITYDTFDDLEQAAVSVLESAAPGAPLAGRVWRQTVFRPHPGVSVAIDERLASSALVGPDDRRCLAPNGLQLWFRTDLLASNFLVHGQVLEMNHVFPLPSKGS